MNVPVTFRRILSRGDWPESDGGLYNPGAWHDAVNDQAYMIVRHEEDYTWTKPCRATVTIAPVGGDLTAEDVSEPTSIPFVGYEEGYRFEDLRPFAWRDHVIIAHVAYKPRSGEPVRQRLSVLSDSWADIHPWDNWDLPVPLAPCEKNWALGSHKDELFTVYSLDPFIVCRLAGSQWQLVHTYQTGLTKAFGKPLHNSTHLLPFDGGHLGFWHYILDRSYVTGAYWLDHKLNLQKRTPILIDGNWVQEDVFKRGVCYVSSAIVSDETMYLFYGEGDAHSGVATIAVDDLRRVLTIPRPNGIRR